MKLTGAEIIWESLMKEGVDVVFDHVGGETFERSLKLLKRGGRIVLAARPAADGVELRVQDDGPGIPPEDVELVFERLYRSDASRQRDAGGSGLGLAIAKSIVEAHGGSIHAESAPEAGTTIVVTLPVGASGAGSPV